MPDGARTRDAQGFCFEQGGDRIIDHVNVFLFVGNDECRTKCSCVGDVCADVRTEGVSTSTVILTEAEKDD